MKNALIALLVLPAIGLTNAQPHLLQTIDISSGGFGQRMLLGDVTGNGRMEMVMMQGDYMVDDRYIGHEVNCLTAFTIEGEQLWQIGDPSKGSSTGSDIPAQVYDIDADGQNEVLACMNGKLRIFDGKTGKEEDSFNYPHPDAHDCIIICNLRGTEHPQDIILKDRYSQVWAMDWKGNEFWTYKGNTGHFPWPYDFDGDGKEEIICGYDYLDDGKKIWSANQTGHADCIWVGNVDGDESNGMEIAQGGDDVTVYGWKGNLIWRNDDPIEPQNIAIGDFRPDLPGFEVAGQDRRDRSDPGEEAIFLIDGKGEMVTYNIRSGWYSILYSMENWAGNHEDYIMIWRSRHKPALYNGKIENIVEFPVDGYMMSADMNGNGINEVILFTDTKAYIYGSSDYDILQKVEGIPTPRPQLKKHYQFTRYWGGQYDKEMSTGRIITAFKEPINVYPNPAGRVIYIEPGPILTPHVNICIYDISGKPVLANRNHNVSSSIDLESLSGGLYLIRVESGSEVYHSRFIKR